MLIVYAKGKHTINCVFNSLAIFMMCDTRDRQADIERVRRGEYESVRCWHYGVLVLPVPSQVYYC